MKNVEQLMKKLVSYVSVDQAADEVDIFFSFSFLLILLVVISTETMNFLGCSD